MSNSTDVTPSESRKDDNRRTESSRRSERRTRDEKDHGEESRRDRDRSDRDRDRKRRNRDSRSASRSPKRKRRPSHENGESEAKEGDTRAGDGRTHSPDVEDGEVNDNHNGKPKVLSSRELERQRIINEELKNGNADEEDEPVWSMRKAQEEKSTRKCPYLDTIDRSVLDFDFEKLCSVSLSHLNVYACMICGKYFQGRGTNTHAYTHSLDCDHRVFLNLSTLKFYCLPDNYEIVDPSLEDIKYVLKPTFSKEQITNLNKQTKMVRACDDSPYYPGVVGLNNIKANDYTNVVFQALSHVTPLRNYFLREENYEKIKRPPGDKLSLLPKRFGELIRKLWNPRAFRTHVSPHEMLQATVICSEKKFQFIKQGDASEFLTFLLNTLHNSLNGTNKFNSSIIYKIFRGKMRQYSRKILPAETTEEQQRHLLSLEEYQEQVQDMPFLFLTLDLPPMPLYGDPQMEKVIPQVPLHVLLQKFNGVTEKEYKTYKDNIMKRFVLLKLPDYLIITYKRFHKNLFFMEKNNTIVNFPISNVDMYECLAEEVREEHKYTTYDLIANIVHDSLSKEKGKDREVIEGSYRVQVVHTGSQKWYELEDLHVKEILPQVIVLAESYIQIWKLNKSKTREERSSEGVDGESMEQ